MDRPQSNPAHQDQSSGHKPSEQPTPISSIESLFPTANANQLLSLIAQGNDPSDLNTLIKDAA